MSDKREESFKKGDIIFIRYRNSNSEYTSHPLVITTLGKVSLWAVDSRSLFAAFALSDANSSYSRAVFSKVFSEDLTKTSFANKINKNPMNNDSILKIDALHLYSKDVLPTDVKGRIPESFVNDAIKVFEDLEKKGEASFDIFNFPDVIKSKE